MNTDAAITRNRAGAHWKTLAKWLFDELRERTGGSEGVDRECYAAGEQRAIDLLIETAEAHGLSWHYDAAANLWITLPDDDPAKPAIVVGSHADSVPHGGNFDGGAGIVAGLMCLIRCQQERRGAAPMVRLLVLRGEESAFYGRANIGSRALFGQLTATDLRARRHGGNNVLRDAMSAAGADMRLIVQGRPIVSPQSILAFLELHIEQGPELIARNLPTAIVTGIRGNLRHRRVVCHGETGHSGTVPRRLRRDSVFAVSDLMMRLDEHWTRFADRGHDVVVTSGVCGTDPAQHAISLIPGEVSFSFEVRSESSDTLESFYEVFRSECSAVSEKRGVSFTFDDRICAEPARMSDTIVNCLMRHSDELDLVPELLPSGAGHDAAVFANVGIPSGMIFVRNRNGSHNPHETMDLDDFMCGADLMHAFVADSAKVQDWNAQTVALAPTLSDRQ